MYKHKITQAYLKLRFFQNVFSPNCDFQSFELYVTMRCSRRYLQKYAINRLTDSVEHVCIFSHRRNLSNEIYQHRQLYVHEASCNNFVKELATTYGSYMRVHVHETFCEILTHSFVSAFSGTPYSILNKSCTKTVGCALLISKRFVTFFVLLWVSHQKRSSWVKPLTKPDNLTGKFKFGISEKWKQIIFNTFFMSGKMSG